MDIRMVLKLRDTDVHGSGSFGAPRGSRTHKGDDYACPVGSSILAPINGKVTKIGYPYGDDLSFRYVEITVSELRYRVFYVEPIVEVGDIVTRQDVIGHSQKLGDRYNGITEHVHFEILRPDGSPINPKGM